MCMCAHMCVCMSVCVYLCRLWKGLVAHTVEGRGFVEYGMKTNGPCLPEIQRAGKGDAQAGAWDPPHVGVQCQPHG